LYARVIDQSKADICYQAEDNISCRDKV